MLIYRRHAMIKFYEQMLKTLVEDYVVLDEDEQDDLIDDTEACANVEVN